MNKYILPVTVFLSGAIVMIFELVGSRVLGPYVGTSLFVWTSLIGIILGSMSIGYALGGKLADKGATLSLLSIVLFLAAVCISITALLKDHLLLFLQMSFREIRFTSIVSSILLFAPTGVLLGIVSPYAVKLSATDTKNLGKTVGNLSAISTAGSIVGTFLAGFYLIPTLGTNHILFLIAAILAILSIIVAINFFKLTKLITIALLIFCWIISGKIILPFSLNKSLDFHDVDTAYNRVWIFTATDPLTKQKARYMAINNENSSAMFLNSTVLVHPYTKYYNLAEHFNPNFQKTLMLGGAAYSYPKEFLSRYKTATIDVVEIDPRLTKLAQQYFQLTSNPRLNIVHEDGRIYLNHTTNKYDVIYGDAFSSHYSLPYQLTTRESIQRQFDLLNPDGIVIVNIISSIEGTQGEFLRAEYATYRSVFQQVYLFPVNESNKGNSVQNIMLLAVKSDKIPSWHSPNTELDSYLQHLWKNPISLDMPILTDDYAPVDHYIGKIIL